MAARNGNDRDDNQEFDQGKSVSGNIGSGRGIFICYISVETLRSGLCPKLAVTFVSGDCYYVNPVSL